MKHDPPATLQTKLLFYAFRNDFDCGLTLKKLIPLLVVLQGVEILVAAINLVIGSLRMHS